MTFTKKAKFSVRVLGGASALALAFAMPALAENEQTKTFNIEAQPLSEALLEYSRQSEVNVIAPSSVTQGRMSHPVNGEMTPKEALDKLIDDSSLSYKTQEDGSIVLVLASAEEASDERNGFFRLAQADAQGSGTDAAVNADDEEERDVIVVTGTNIRGGVQISNVISIDSIDIERSGMQTTGDVIRSLPQSFGGGVNLGVGDGAANNSRNFRINSAASSANLRGLGSESTLALVNGQRLSSTDYVAASDISLIPVAAIERVEVLTDGASAIYGSDAVGGVVNFILKDSYEGLRVSGTASLPTRGGGEQYIGNVLGGASWDTGGFIASYEYAKSKILEGRERDFVDPSLDELSLLPDLDRHSGFLRFHQDLSPDLEFVLTGLYTKKSLMENQLAPQFFFQIDFDTEASQSALAGQLNWDVSDTWRVTASGNWATQKSDQDQSQYFLGILFGEITASSRNLSLIGDIKADGVLFEAPSGEIRLAAGYGYRHEEMTTPLEVSPNKRDVHYVFGEISGPLLSAKTSGGADVLSFSLAGRYENYSDFGGTTTPKAGLSLRPNDDLRLFGTWSESFHAPSLQQLFRTGNGILLYEADPLPLSGTSLLLIVSGSNPDLMSEEATTWNAGFEYDPPFIEGARITLSYFDIDYKDRIALPVYTLFSQVFTDPILAPYLIRMPSVAEQADALSNATLVNLSGMPYDPTTVDALFDGRYANIGAEHAKGFDLGVTHHLELGDGGLDTSLNATWLDLTRQEIIGAPTREVSGLVFNPPEFRLRAGVTYSIGGASLSAYVNHMGDFSDPATSPATPVDSLTTLDLRAAYQFDNSSVLKGFSLSVAAINVTDEDPPAVNSPSVAVPYGYDTANASPLGRVITIQLVKEF